MTAPVRIQRKRMKGYRMPGNTVSVTRPGPFSNPWSIRFCADEFGLSDEAARERVIEWFREWVSLPNDDEALDELGGFPATRDRHKVLHARLSELRGKNLACWCALDQPCHADVLLELANRPICDEVSP